MNNNIEQLNINVKAQSEEEKLAKGLLKLYDMIIKVGDMSPLELKGKHPDLYKFLLDIEAGV